MKTPTLVLTAIYVKEKISPEEFYRRELPTMPRPKRNGWCNGGICPFHYDTRPGSFFVNTNSGAFRCHSCGTGGGDVIAFVMQRDGLPFVKALQHLIQDWRIS